MRVSSASQRHGFARLVSRLQVRDRLQNLRRLQAQRNDLNSKVRSLREELQLLQQPGSHVGEVVKVRLRVLRRSVPSAAPPAHSTPPLPFLR